MVRFRRDLLTSDETTTVGGEIRHEGSHFFWSSDAWNWRRQVGLQRVLLLGPVLRGEIETVVLTTPLAPPGFAPLLEPVKTPNSSTGDGLYLAQSSAGGEEETYPCECL